LQLGLKPHSTKFIHKQDTGLSIIGETVGINPKHYHKQQFPLKKRCLMTHDLCLETPCMMLLPQLQAATFWSVYLFPRKSRPEEAKSACSFAFRLMIHLFVLSLPKTFFLLLQLLQLC